MEDIQVSKDEYLIRFSPLGRRRVTYWHDDWLKRIWRERYEELGFTVCSWFDYHFSYALAWLILKCGGQICE